MLKPGSVKKKYWSMLREVLNSDGLRFGQIDIQHAMTTQIVSQSIFGIRWTIVYADCN